MRDDCREASSILNPREREKVGEREMSIEIRDTKARN